MTGNFIELCRRSFQYTYFEDRDTLLEDGRVLPDLQSRAARDLASSELEMIKRIPSHGNALYTFAKNLGNIFGEYHRDLFIRYPETNQFTIDMSSIEDVQLQKAFAAAIEWSVIQRKQILQQDVPGGHRTEVYTLNRVLSPIFDLTYRTRGGFSEDYDASHLSTMMTQENVRPRMSLDKKPRIQKLLQKRLI